MKYSNVAASSMQRIGMFALHQAVTAPTGESAKNIKAATAFGACYVLTRGSTALLGKWIVSRLARHFELNSIANPKDKEKLIQIKMIVHGSLWIPAIAMSWKLANLSGIPISFKSAAITACLGTFYSFFIGTAVDGIEKKFNVKLPRIRPICAELDPLPTQ